MLKLKVAKNEIGRDCTILYKTDISSFSCKLPLIKNKKGGAKRHLFYSCKSRWVKALALVPA